MCNRTNAQKLVDFLNVIGETVQEVGLHQWENYQRLLFNALHSELRFKQLSQRGSVYNESVAEHLFNILRLGSLMIDLERLRRIDLDEALLLRAFSIHDFGESIMGDIDYSKKTANDEVKEDESFRLIIGVNMQTKRDMDAYRLSQEWLDAGAKQDPSRLLDISINGRFFAAVEIIGYVSRALLEMSNGNTAFVNVLYNAKDHLEILKKEFFSVAILLDPVSGLIEEYLKQFPYAVFEDKIVVDEEKKEFKYPPRSDAISLRESLFLIPDKEKYGDNRYKITMQRCIEHLASYLNMREPELEFVARTALGNLLLDRYVELLKENGVSYILITKKR